MDKLKLELIARINQIDDIEILNQISELLDEAENNLILNEPAEVYQKEDVYIFTPEQRKKIEIALKQVENGECISHEEAEKEIQAWLK